MSKLAKVARQHEKTWAQLNRRLMSIPFNYDVLFPEAVAKFVQNKAESLSSCPGYLVPCLLASTAFVIAGNNVIQTRSHEMPANLYIVFVGPPTTGKSPALKEGALDPMLNLKLERDLPNFIIEKCTSSALVKSVAATRQGFIISPEIYEVLNKLLKSDEEHATGDAQVLCQLFSGERTSYRFATENVRDSDKCALFNPWHHAGTIRCQVNLPNGSRSWPPRPVSISISKLPSSDDRAE